jgi:hypothetical protein
MTDEELDAAVDVIAAVDACVFAVAQSTNQTAPKDLKTRLGTTRGRQKPEYSLKNLGRSVVKIECLNRGLALRHCCYWRGWAIE